MSAWWWGSREQVVFLEVLGALLRPAALRDSGFRSSHVVISLDDENHFNDSVVHALMYCPGPWDQQSFELIYSNRHDEMSLVAGFASRAGAELPLLPLEPA